MTATSTPFEWRPLFGAWGVWTDYGVYTVRGLGSSDGKRRFSLELNSVGLKEHFNEEVLKRYASRHYNSFKKKKSSRR